MVAGRYVGFLNVENLRFYFISCGTRSYVHRRVEIFLEALNATDPAHGTESALNV